MRRTWSLVLFAAALACATVPPPRQAPIRIPLPAPPRPLPELVAQLSAPDAPSRAAAAWSIAGAGLVDAAVIQALVAALEDPSEPVREAATWGLSHVGGPGTRPDQLMDTFPKALVMTRPHYPRPEFVKRIQGTVLVTILISSIGRVVHAEVRESIPGLDEAALACVRDWQFQPAMRQGRPVPSVAAAPVTFRIY